MNRRTKSLRAPTPIEMERVLAALASAPVPAAKPASKLDGLLTGLLNRRNEVELELERAKLKIEEFLGACTVITETAMGRPVKLNELPPGVLVCLEEIRRHYGAERRVRNFVQRAD